MSRNTLTKLVLALSVLLAGCVQHTLEPNETNLHTVRIETIKPAGSVAKNVDIALFEDQTPGALQDYAGNTGDSGAVNIRLAIPTFGHSYLLVANKKDPFGGLLFDRPVYPLTLNCADTLVRIIVPEPDAANILDSICGQDIANTLTFYSCADTFVTQTFTLKNCSAGLPYTATVSPLKPPFSITPLTAQIAPGASLTFTITYDARDQTSDASAQTLITTTPQSGTATLTLIGHLKHDCNNTTQLLQCGVNGTSDTIRFGTVCQNTLTGAECVSFVNSNNTPVTVGFPKAPAPFSYNVTDKNGANVNISNPLTLQRGESMTICVSVNAPDVGKLAETLTFPLACPGATASYTVPLSANVKACTNCNCSDYFHDPVTLSDNVRVGTDTTFTTEIFHNGLNCPVTVGGLSSDQGTAWSVLSVSPALPAIVAPGGSVSATVRFKPGKAGTSQTHVRFAITVQGAASNCTGEIDLKGTGCNSACALLSLPPDYRPSPAPNGPDTLFVQQAGNPKVLVSYSGNTSASDPECITLRYPDTACSQKQIAIVQPRDSKWQVTTVPSPLVLSPGGVGEICVTFTAPTIDQVRKDFPNKGAELKYTDVLTIIDPDNCSQVVPLKAVVDTLPQCKEFDLAQYDFVGAQQVVYHEIYSFDGGRQDNVVPAAAGVPSAGDMYLKAATQFSSVSGNVPPGFYNWKNDQTPICNNIKNVNQQLTALGPAGQTFNATLNVAQYDWIVVKVRGGTYAVIQVTTTYLDGYNIPHAVCSVLYPFFY